MICFVVGLRILFWFILVFIFLLLSNLFWFFFFTIESFKNNLLICFIFPACHTFDVQIWHTIAAIAKYNQRNSYGLSLLVFILRVHRVFVISVATVVKIIPIPVVIYQQVRRRIISGRIVIVRGKVVLVQRGVSFFRVRIPIRISCCQGASVWWIGVFITWRRNITSWLSIPCPWWSWFTAATTASTPTASTAATPSPPKLPILPIDIWRDINHSLLYLIILIIDVIVCYSIRYSNVNEDCYQKLHFQNIIIRIS